MVLMRCQGRGILNVQGIVFESNSPLLSRMPVAHACGLKKNYLLLFRITRRLIVVLVRSGPHGAIHMLLQLLQAATSLCGGIACTRLSVRRKPRPWRDRFTPANDYLIYAGVGRAFSRICLFVCLFVRALKGTRLELSAPKSVDRTSACTDPVVKRSNLNPNPWVTV